MSFLPALLRTIGNGLLSEPGDKLSAEITSTGRQVVKVDTSKTKRSIVRYKTGTVVETIVHRNIQS